MNRRGFAYFRYRTNNDRNYWNCICSAMDWIIVAVEHINSMAEDNTKSMSAMEVFTCIASVDIIIEAVQQLHRVIQNTDPLLFKDETDVFEGNQFFQNDYRYFKTIRSCFGAHPVNLEEPGSPQNTKLRRFASWPYAIWKNETASIILHSNQKDEKDIFLSIDLQQILRYGNKYYQHLIVLGDSLEKQYEQFAAEKRREMIPSPENPIEHLSVLLEASKNRLDKGEYKSHIEEMQLLYKTPVTNDANVELVTGYRKDLQLLIADIHNHLQYMDDSALVYEDILYPRFPDSSDGWGYWCEKMTEYIFSNSCPPGLWEPQIRKRIEPYVQLQYSSYDELYLLVKATLYYLQKQSDHKLFE